MGNDCSTKSDVPFEMLDAEVIYIYKAIRKCNKDVQILTELVSSRNIEFLMPDGNKVEDFVKSTLYAAGEVYQSSIIDTLTCASYFNEHLVTVLQQILNGGVDDDDEISKQSMRAHPDLTQSNLW